MYFQQRHLVSEEHKTTRNLCVVDEMMRNNTTNKDHVDATELPQNTNTYGKATAQNRCTG